MYDIDFLTTHLAGVKEGSPYGHFQMGIINVGNRLQMK
jgi:hypothetical protein